MAVDINIKQKTMPSAVEGEQVKIEERYSCHWHPSADFLIMDFREPLGTPPVHTLTVEFHFSVYISKDFV